MVERFDRELVDATADTPAWIVRLPQEDLCQATGTPAWRKYESEGGPGIARCLELLAAGERAERDALTFVMAQLAFWLLAAPDGHAKNFAIFLLRDGHRMAPLYDVISAWPIVGRGANQWPSQRVTPAMALRGSRPHRRLDRIAVRDWRGLAVRSGVAGAFEQMVAMVERVEPALRRVEGLMSPGFPERVWSRIERGVLGQQKGFLAEMGKKD